MAGDFTLKRQTKIARTLIRLKHSLAADEEIEDYLSTVRQNLIEGKGTKMVTTLEEITGED